MVQEKEATATIIPFWEKEEPATLPPAQYNLLTGEPDLLPQVVDREIEDELRVSDEIMLARTGDASQLVLSGFGLFLSKKEERLLVEKAKNFSTSFPFTA